MKIAPCKGAPLNPSSSRDPFSPKHLRWSGWDGGVSWIFVLRFVVEHSMGLLLCAMHDVIIFIWFICIYSKQTFRFSYADSDSGVEMCVLAGLSLVFLFRKIRENSEFRPLWPKGWLVYYRKSVEMWFLTVFVSVRGICEIENYLGPQWWMKGPSTWVLIYEISYTSEN